MNTQFTTTDSQSACAMVEAGLGLTLNNALNSRRLGHRIVAMPLVPQQFVEIGIAVTPQASPAVRTFLNALLDAIQEQKLNTSLHDAAAASRNNRR